MTNNAKGDDRNESSEVMHETMGNPTSNDEHIEEIEEADEKNETGSGYTRKEE